jgi:hypothetical protein
MPRLPIALAALFLVACGGESASPPEAPAEAATAAAAGKPNLGCGAPFAQDASFASLQRTFGAANVVDQTVPGPEGTTLDATVLFGNDPARRIEVLWVNEQERAGLLHASIAGERSDVRGPGGLRLGVTLTEVEAINGGPFTLMGFNWDMGGAVVDWQGGALSRERLGCSVSVSFDPGADSAAVTGDSPYASTLPAMRAAAPRVTRIGIGYPAPEPGMGVE